MPINLRHRANGLVGRPVIAQQINGTVYRGILHRVTDDGVYIRQMQGAGTVSDESRPVVNKHADQAELKEGEMSLVWFPFLFLPWLALGGLWWW